MEEQNQAVKTLKGYKIIIVILAVVLVALAFLHFRQVGTMREEFDVERDTLVSRLGVMRDGLNSLQTENDTINHNLDIERHKADSLMDRLVNERSLNIGKIRAYERELGTLRTAMRGFVQTIDSLDRINQVLASENVLYRREASTLRLRAETAEERALELDTKVRKGAMILARNISLKAINNSDAEVTRANRASRLRTDFVLTANELATPGNREVYIRISGPDGYLLASSSNNV
ncbi:MAG: hypothetical protein LBU80_05165, partial [Rikenellaceae bacterium]|nr:hypothetical protein [Rikenellaceae bacterium]